MTTEILDIETVAKLLDVNQWTIYRLAKEGKIPAFKVGRQWRFKREALERWMDRKSNLEQRFDKLLEKLRQEGAEKGITQKEIERAIQEAREL